jgi:hypothetical protein
VGAVPCTRKDQFVEAAVLRPSFFFLCYSETNHGARISVPLHHPAAFIQAPPPPLPCAFEIKPAMLLERKGAMPWIFCFTLSIEELEACTSTLIDLFTWIGVFQGKGLEKFAACMVSVSVYTSKSKVDLKCEINK